MRSLTSIKWASFLAADGISVDAELADEACLRIRFTADFQCTRHRDRAVIGQRRHRVVYLDHDDIVRPVRIARAERADGHGDFRQNEEPDGRRQRRRHVSGYCHLASGKALRLVREGESFGGVSGIDFREIQVFSTGCPSGKERQERSQEEKDESSHFLLPLIPRALRMPKKTSVLSMVPWKYSEPGPPALRRTSSAACASCASSFGVLAGMRTSGSPRWMRAGFALEEAEDT